MRADCQETGISSGPTLLIEYGTILLIIIILSPQSALCEQSMIGEV